MKQNPHRKRSFWERYALKQLSSETNSQEEQLAVLDEKEIAELQRIQWQTYLKAGLAGALGVILLYLPYHIFGESLFPKRSFQVPYFGQKIELEIEFLVFSVILVFIEIWYLTYVNIKSVTAIAKACGCPSQSDPRKEENKEALISVSLEKKQNELEQLGINPYEGLSPWGVWTFQMLVRLKATISGFLWKLIVTKILGRYAFRLLVDLFGAPLYAAFNIYAARKIMNEARVRVMAPPLIRELTQQLHEEFRNREDFRQVLYSALHAISVSKRSFHYNHFLLASSILDAFEIELEGDPEFDRKVLEHLDELPEDVRFTIAKLIVFGILIDGKLSMIEKRSIRTMHKEGVLPYSEEQIEKWAKDFFKGKGLQELIEAK
ncbi:MAG: hypothetical protein EP338_06005 [Bacteroidetes bacterium]|nr:MAG: hypothetical protein EP338_06005 [Bacteroidota bacterium]